MGLAAMVATLVAVIGSATVWMANDNVSSGAAPAVSHSMATPEEGVSGAASSTTATQRASTATQRASRPTATQRASSPIAASSARRISGSAHRPATIQLQRSAAFVKAFETFEISGTRRGGADSFLRVQRLEHGQWLAFPLPTKADRSGRFTTYVELGRPGRYRLRVVDSDSGVKSKPIRLLVKA